MLENIKGYYLRRNGKYLTSLKKWSMNINKAMEFKTEKEIRAFQYSNNYEPNSSTNRPASKR